MVPPYGIDNRVWGRLTYPLLLLIYRKLNGTLLTTYLLLVFLTEGIDLDSTFRFMMDFESLNDFDLAEFEPVADAGVKHRLRAPFEAECSTLWPGTSLHCPYPEG
jgi:hypothetical protein